MSAELLAIAAEVSTTNLMRPDGTKVPGWVVTAYERGPEQEPDRVVFSGPNGSARATEYARARYERVNYRMHAETGRIGGAVQPLRGAA